METLIVVALVVKAIGFFISLIPSHGGINSFGFGLMIGGVIFVMAEVILDDEPTAMDVYQNKTTLKITYENGVPVDSVVVYKNK